MAENETNTDEVEVPEVDAANEPAAEAPAEEAAAEEPTAGPEPAQASAAEAAEQVRRPKKRLPRHARRQRPKPKSEPGKERKPIVRLPKPERPRGREQERRGVVVSSAMDKTIVVRVEIVKAHPRYKKIIRRSSKLHAHDEQNAANVGDFVRIVETRPLSSTKRWRLAEILETAK
jgi:small subunit ribosomal protein S17